MDEDTSTSTNSLGSIAMDSYVVRRKQVGLLHSTHISGIGEDGQQIHSNLLKPGTTYSAPTKFSPFKPLDLYPYGLKTSDFSENPNLSNPTATSRSSSSNVAPKPASNPWLSPITSSISPITPTSSPLRCVASSTFKIGEIQNSIPSSPPKVLSPEPNHATGPHSSPKSRPNSARKLHEVFQEEKDRVDDKERLASLFHSIEVET